MRDFANNIQVRRVLSPVATAANDTAQVGEIIDRLGFDSLTYIIAMGAVPDADATFTVLLEESDAANAVAEADMISKRRVRCPRRRPVSSSMTTTKSGNSATSATSGTRA